MLSIAAERLPGVLYSVQSQEGLSKFIEKAPRAKKV